MVIQIIRCSVFFSRRSGIREVDPKFKMSRIKDVDPEFFFFFIRLLLINSKSSRYQPLIKPKKNILEATGKVLKIKHTKYDNSLFTQTFEQELGTRNILHVNASTDRS